MELERVSELEQDATRKQRHRAAQRAGATTAGGITQGTGGTEGSPPTLPPRKRGREMSLRERGVLDGETTEDDWYTERPLAGFTGFATRRIDDKRPFAGFTSDESSDIGDATTEEEGQA